MTVGIVGLGLTGGSAARAYKSSSHRVLGADIDKATLGYAQLSGIIDGELTSESIGTCDVIFYCPLPPRLPQNILNETVPL